MEANSLVLLINQLNVEQKNGNFEKKKKMVKLYVFLFRTHGTHHSLLTMLEKWRNSLDKSENVLIFYSVT